MRSWERGYFFKTRTYIIYIFKVWKKQKKKRRTKRILSSAEITITWARLCAKRDTRNDRDKSSGGGVACVYIIIRGEAALV